MSTAGPSPAPTGPSAGVAEVADLVRDAVLAVPGVARLHGGAFGEAATYLPGRTVEGVRVRPGSTEVHIVLSWGSPVRGTADAVRAAATAVTGTVIDVTIQDVAAPDAPIPLPSPEPSRPSP